MSKDTIKDPVNERRVLSSNFYNRKAPFAIARSALRSKPMPVKWKACNVMWKGSSKVASINVVYTHTHKQVDRNSRCESYRSYSMIQQPEHMQFRSFQTDRK